MQSILAVMKRRLWLAVMLGAAVGWAALPAHAADETAPAFVQRVTTQTLEQVKADKSLRNGDVAKIMQLVDAQLMPHVNFRRMTASATGPAWRKASPEQQKRLQDEFKLLLVRTYSGALQQVGDQTVAVKPLRAGQEDQNTVVNTELRGKGEPIQLDYRLEKHAQNGWQIFDLNVMGIWLIETYRAQFSKEINANGIDGLIQSLSERNKANAAGRKG